MGMKDNVKLHKKSLNPEERIKRIKRLMNSDLDKKKIKVTLNYLR